MKKQSSYLVVMLSLAVVFLFSCSRDYVPKPKGYNRLDLPPHEYQLLPDTLPYFFEYSKHALLLKDTSIISEPDWIEVYYPNLKADVHITYKKVKGDTQRLKEFMEDAYFLVSKHQVKAYAIDDIIMTSPSGKTFSIAELEGEVPSQFQFVCTDSVTNFLRGALYFNTRVNNDSLQPAIEFVKADVVHMMNTLEWKD
ncbi:MAG: gliding motility lipoprotein GldD [Cyclobacteriaceae bacterium]|nr:gliding motility lipoprotein GldD [Cyclobacteriaceae bacterium]